MRTRVVGGSKQGPVPDLEGTGTPAPSGAGRVKVMDPIEALVERRRAETEAESAPLVSLDIGVTIRGGLALVETRRTYVNRERKPIEALLSIPVPIHAAFFGLTARIGGKLHRARAMPRSAAREAYEDAIDEGKTAVLHEELLRGVHALSVANIASGEEAEVTTCWAEPLRYQGSSGQLRIPLTVGDVYGLSGLPETDELVHRGPETPTTVRIQHDASGVHLADGALLPSPDGGLVAEVPANAPVDIEVTGWSGKELVGRAANGREVFLTIERDADGDEPLDLAMLIDHSGSMQSPCEGRSRRSMSKHQAVRNALRDLGGLLRNGDRIALWEFDHSCRSVGTGDPVGPSEFRRLVPRLSGPAGGTEIGQALDTIASVGARDVLLVTDGMSYALDVQRHALAGRRVFVVLVGEDSLEAKVGHLAALTGGDLQFSFGGDVERALVACVRGMRTRRAKDAVCEVDAGGSPQRVRTARGGASIEARWTGKKADCDRDSFSGAVAAYSASLAVAASNEEVATEIAVEEDLVTHLTSLFLAVEDGERHEDLPVTRKSRLPTPRTGVLYQRAMAQSVAMPFIAPTMQMQQPPCQDVAETVSGVDCLQEIGEVIDWDAMGPALARGDLSGMPSWVADAVRTLSELPELESAALSLGIDSLRVAIALVAHAASGSRAAVRVRRRLLRSVDSAQFETFVQEFEASRVPRM